MDSVLLSHFSSSRQTARRLGRCWLVLSIGLLSGGLAWAQPPSAPASGAETASDEIPSNLKHQRGRAWMKAGVRNTKMGSAFLAESSREPGMVTTKGGLRYKILKEGPEGSEKPKMSDTVQVRYQGVLMDGTPFDRSPADGKPKTVKMEEVIPAWRQALKFMSVGSKWHLVVPPNLGYGNEGLPPLVGPDAVLIYDLELVAIKKEPTTGNSPKSGPDTGTAKEADSPAHAKPSSTIAPK